MSNGGTRLCQAHFGMRDMQCPLGCGKFCVRAEPGAVNRELCELAAAAHSGAQAMAVLRELVDLKNMHDRIETESAPDEWHELENEYRRRKPIAWARARALLGLVS